MSPLACSLLALAALIATAYGGDSETLYGQVSDNDYTWPIITLPPAGQKAEVTNVCGGPRPRGVRVHATNGPNDHWPVIASLNYDHTQVSVTCTPEGAYSCAMPINVRITQYC